MSAHNHLALVKDKLTELAKETNDAKKSAEFQHYLDTMSRFWEYSYHNQLLIYFANAEASKVAGFNTWRKLGRQVKKGSKAIKIVAPFISKKVNEKNGKEEATTYFAPVSVFDISQTEGKDLPDLVRLSGDDCRELLNTLIEFCEISGIKLDFEKLGINGLFGYSQGGSIKVAEGESVNTQVNTLVHEIAHELLHWGDRKSLTKQEKEIEAEGTAYVVCKHFGLDVKSYNYLASYNVTPEKIMVHLEAIATASKQILEFFSFSFKEKNNL